MCVIQGLGIEFVFVSTSSLFRWRVIALISFYLLVPYFVLICFNQLAVYYEYMKLHPEETQEKNIAALMFYVV